MNHEDSEHVDHPRSKAIFLLPNLLTTAQKRGVPLALVSARITDKTAQGWKKAPGMARALMNGFSHVWPQDQDSADRLTALGARPAPRLGPGHRRSQPLQRRDLHGPGCCWP